MPKEISPDERINSMGFFNTADTYWKSAAALQAAKVNATHAEVPVRLLYYHAMELFLKALLREEYSPEQIRKTFGHKTRALMEATDKMGLVLTKKDCALLEMIQDTDLVIEARYITMGYKSW